MQGCRGMTFIIIIINVRISRGGIKRFGTKFIEIKLNGMLASEITKETKAKRARGHFRE
jgi:hypothetical protein